MEYLTEVMIRNGFEPIRSEWWHFNDSEVRSYDLIDLTFEEWVAAYISAEGEHHVHGDGWRKVYIIWEKSYPVWHILSGMTGEKQTVLSSVV